MLALKTLALLLPAVLALESKSTVNPYAPSQLWSPLVASKVYAYSKNVSSTSYPQYTTRDTGTWVNFGVDYWTSGFLPVLLYAMNTRDTLCPSAASGHDWLELGREWSRGLVSLEAHNTVGHDVGFISMPFVEELSLNPSNSSAESNIVAFGKVLASRYNPVVGCTRSWDTSDPTDFQVIIDNMMNLELLFLTTELTGDNAYRQMAITHADRTLIEGLRPDGGSYHVVEYNSTTGKAFKKRTAQGYSDSSTWSRGQSWGVYGFANMHRRTGNATYLDTARKMASYFLSRMPSSGVVPWDFDAPATADRPTDSSAAMVVAQGMLLISQEEQNLGNSSGATYWAQSASKIYRDNVNSSWKPEWQSLLNKGTVNNPSKNNMTGIIYGDYYFINVGNTMIQMGLADCSN